MRAIVRWLSVAAAIAATAAVFAPATAGAVPRCPDARAPRTLIGGQGVLESAIVDGRGRFFYSDATRRAIMRVERPGERPVPLARGIESPGGLVLDTDGSLVAGQGNSIANGVIGNLVGQARLLRIDPDSGATVPLASGLSMANGLARGPDGSIYASNDFGIGLDRVRGRRVQRGWATVVSANGLALDPSGRFLYAAQTFVPAAIQRVDLRDPRRVTEYARPPLEDLAAGLDGMASDAAGSLYVTAVVPGEVWRVGTDRRICAVARGIPNARAVALGRGPDGFSAGNAYAVSGEGRVVELRGAVP